MSRQHEHPDNFRLNIYNPITIDADGPFGLSVCQPSTVPRQFRGPCSVHRFQGLYKNSSAVDELDEILTEIVLHRSNISKAESEEPIYAECSELNQSPSTLDKSFVHRKMSTMPRPFASRSFPHPGRSRRCFSVQHNYPIGACWNTYNFQREHEKN